MTGMVGVISDYAGRYSWFSQCLADLVKPEGTKIEWRMGANRGAMRNALAQACLDQERDWLLFIENVYPEEWSQLAEVLGLSVDTRREYMRVSERVARSRRRPKLDWSQHRAVAALPPPEQKEWLRKAETERMSHHQLRDALRDGKPEVEQTHCRCCHRPL